MTANQIAYASHREQARHNVAVEGETQRANLAKEGETHRHNVVSEVETERSNKEKEAHNWASLSETATHNRRQEAISSYTASEQAKHWERSDLNSRRANQIQLQKNSIALQDLERNTVRDKWTMENETERVAQGWVSTIGSLLFGKGGAANAYANLSPLAGSTNYVWDARPLY